MATKTKTAPAKPSRAKAPEAPPEPPSRQVTIRLPIELVARLDRHQARLQAANPGLGIKKADTIRVLLTRALDEVEGVDR